MSMTTPGRASTAVIAFGRSLVLLVAISVLAPWGLVEAARARFGGASPLRGVVGPADWDLGAIGRALTDRLTERTLADVVIRMSLVVAWFAIVVVVLTVAAEVVHMVRHDGLPLPNVHGLGVSQSAARVIASGLLVIVPLFVTPSRAAGRDGTLLVAHDRATATALTARARSLDTPPNAADSVGIGSFPSKRPADLPPPSGRNPGGAASTSSGHIARETGGRYIVRSGDSVYGIAERIAGPDASAVAEYADRLVELNIGRPMIDGRRFANAAFIDVGWELELPPIAARSALTDPRQVHVVQDGESLWSIAADELGDAERWPEIFEANTEHRFPDGRELRDPDLIQPGWTLALPHDGDIATVATDPAGALHEDPVGPPPTGTDNVVSSAPSGVEPDRPANVWIERPAARSEGAVVSQHAEPDVAGDPTAGRIASGVPGTSSPGAPSGPTAHIDRPEQRPADGATGLLSLGQAAMMSAGVLTLLAVRRRNQLRRTRPRARLPEAAPGPAATERTLRSIDAGELLARVDMAIRAAAVPMIDHDERPLALLVAPDGEVELIASGPVDLPAPWEASGDRWRLPAATPFELLTERAEPVGPPVPTLVQLGRDAAGRDVYVDLEAVEALEVGGSPDHAEAILAGVAATLAGSTLAEVTTLVGVGVPADAFLGHRLHVDVPDVASGFEAAAAAIGSTALQSTSTFELRAGAGAGSGDAWEPAVVLIGPGAGVIDPPRSRSGLAIVSASPIAGPRCLLAPDGDRWVLQPIGIELIPVGLGCAEINAISALVRVPESAIPRSVDDAQGVAQAPADDDLTLAPIADGDVQAAVSDPVELPWAVLVRLLGPIEVVSGSGERVEFERSKTRELVAWLATHRDRSTRSAARTALWELDVRDATFANVVSEARRSLARLVEPPAGAEWVGRTMTDALPLHDLVLTDADVLAHALDVARLQPPAQAIATLRPAVEWITGMPFEGTSYLWPDSEGITSNLVLLATSATAELAAHCLSIGDIEGVFVATGRGLQVLPGHEELIGLRMQAHARAGDHAGVRLEWESYERVITADPWSDGEPSPKLVELRRTLLNPSR
jgi:hypothetical protein